MHRKRRLFLQCPHLDLHAHHHLDPYSLLHHDFYSHTYLHSQHCQRDLH